MRLIVISALFLISIGVEAQEDYIPFEYADDTFGFVHIRDSSKNILPSYSEARSFTEGLAAVKKNGKYGYIDVNNEEAIPFSFDGASSFKEGLAIVQSDTLYGAINKAGEYIIHPAYMDLQTLKIANDLYYLSRDTSFFQGLIDSQGNEVISHEYTYIIPLDSYENLAFFTSFQPIDQNKGSFFQQFSRNSYQFSPEKGRHDIYDTKLDKLASKESQDYIDGFQHYQLQRIDDYLNIHINKNSREKVKDVQGILNLPEPDRDTIHSDLYSAYQPMEKEKVEQVLKEHNYQLFNGENKKKGLKKGNTIVIPALYDNIELVNAPLVNVAQKDVSYLEKNFEASYRNKDRDILDIFCAIATKDNPVQFYLYDLKGLEILSTDKQSVTKGTIFRPTSVGFVYSFVKPNADPLQRVQGMVNWKGKTVLDPIYKSIEPIKTGQLLVKIDTITDSGYIERVGLFNKSGKTIISVGEYATIQPFQTDDGLLLTSKSKEFSTNGSKSMSNTDIRYFILQLNNNSYSLMNRFEANHVSIWSLDPESEMLIYRKRLTIAD